MDAKVRGSGPVRPLFSPKPLPLQVRLLVLVAGTLVPMLLLTAVIVAQSYERAKNAASEQLLQITRSTTIAVDRELQNQIAALEVLALSPGLQTEGFEGFRPDAERFLTRFPPRHRDLCCRRLRQTALQHERGSRADTRAAGGSRSHHECVHAKAAADF